jgi:hypothetical protein
VSRQGATSAPRRSFLLDYRVSDDFRRSASS